MDKTRGEFISALGFHQDLMVYLTMLLRRMLATKQFTILPDVLLLYVGTDQKLHRVSPDLCCVGAEHKLVKTYDLRHMPPPEFVIELASESTRENDLQEKKALYLQWLEVKRYIVIDPNTEDGQ